MARPWQRPKCRCDLAEACRSVPGGPARNRALVMPSPQLVQSHRRPRPGLSGLAVSLSARLRFALASRAAGLQRPGSHLIPGADLRARPHAFSVLCRPCDYARDRAADEAALISGNRAPNAGD